MEEFALIKSRVNLNRVNLGIALISDLKVCLLEIDISPINIFDITLTEMIYKSELCFIKIIPTVIAAFSSRDLVMSWDLGHLF